MRTYFNKIQKKGLFMSNYKSNQTKLAKQKTEEILKLLPPFVTQYIHGRENRLSGNTTLTYTYKIKYFFDYLHANNSYFAKKEIRSITLSDLEKLDSVDIEEFTHFLRMQANTFDNSNQNSTVEAYLSTLSSFWNYFLKRGLVSKNPIAIIDRGKKKRKKIIRLESDEKTTLLSAVEYGTGLSKRQQLFHEKNKIRDLTIIELFLDTGIRISELVGLDISDINLDQHFFTVYRKGGAFDKIYFSDYMESVLRDYLMIRENYHPIDGENALFLSREGKRLSVRSIEKMVKKFTTASLSGTNGKITPHKFRATFATDLLAATGNIRLVQGKLGHADISATQLYADISNSQMEETRNILH